MIKKTLQRQYSEILDTAAGRTKDLSFPPEGWLRTARKALGLSMTKLAVRLNLSRPRITRIEQDELSGALTLRTMEKMAQAMNCQFVYAIVPKENTQALLEAQALKAAILLANKAGGHMALEAQALSPEQHKASTLRLAKELLESNAPEIWDN